MRTITGGCTVFAPRMLYFGEWMACRRGELGRLVRHWTRPGEGWESGARAANLPVEAEVFVPALGCGLWLRHPAADPR